MKTIFHNLISEFSASVPEDLSIDSLTTKFSSIFTSDSDISRCNDLLARILDKEVKTFEKNSPSKYFSNTNLSDPTITGRLNILLQGVVSSSKGVSRGSQLTPIQILGSSLDSAPLDIINKISEFCSKSGASKITQMVPAIDRNRDLSITVKVSTVNGKNLGLKFGVGLSTYNPILSNKGEILKKLSNLDSDIDKYSSFFVKLEDYCRAQLSEMGKSQSTDSSSAKLFKMAIYDLSVCKGKIKTFKDFLDSCKSVTPGEWFKYCNSGESLSFLFSIIDLPFVYKHMSSTKYKALNFPTSENDGSSFKDLVLSTISSALMNIVKPQLHNILTADIEKYKVISMGSQLDIPEKEYSTESISLVEKARAESPESVKKHSDPDFIDKESAITTIMYCLASTDLIYYLSSKYIDAKTLGTVYEIGDTYFSSISESFKSLVLDYFKGGSTHG